MPRARAPSGVAAGSAPPVSGIATDPAPAGRRSRSPAARPRTRSRRGRSGPGPRRGAVRSPPRSPGPPPARCRPSTVSAGPVSPCPVARTGRPVPTVRPTMRSLSEVGVAERAGTTPWSRPPLRTTIVSLCSMTSSRSWVTSSTLRSYSSSSWRTAPNSSSVPARGRNTVGSSSTSSVLFGSEFLDGPQDRHQRLVRVRQRGDRLAGVGGDAEAGQQPGRLAVHRAPVDERAPGVQDAFVEQVLRDGQRRHQAQVLVDEADAVPAERRRVLIGEYLLSADEEAGDGIGPVDAVEDLDQGRFPGPVLPDQAHDLAGRDLQADRIQGLVVPERDGHVLEPDVGLATGPGARRARRRAPPDAG